MVKLANQLENDENNHSRITLFCPCHQKLGNGPFHLILPKAP